MRSNDQIMRTMGHKIMRYLLVLIFCFIVFNVSAQDKLKIDSLETLLSKAEKDTAMVKLYIELGSLYENSLPESAIAIYKKALTISEEIRSKEFIAICLNNLGNSFLIKGNYDKAVEYYLKSLLKHEELGDRKGISKRFNNIGMVYWYQGDYNKTTEYFNKSLKISEQIGYKEGLGDTYINFGSFYQDTGNYSEAIIYFAKALEIYEEINDKSGISLSLNNIGLVYKDKGDYTKALEYHTKSLKLHEELDNKSGIATLYNNIGNIHYYQDNLTEAVEYYKKSAKIKESIGDRRGMSGSYSNIGGIFFRQKKYDEALEYFKKSISLNEEFGDRKGLSMGYNNTGLVYKKQGKYSLALECYQKSLAIKEAFGDKNGIVLVRGCITSLYLTQADSSKNTDEKTDLYNMAIKNAESSLKIAKEIGALPHENTIYEDLSHAWSGLKNYKNAFEYSQKFIATKDSLFNNEKTKVIEEMETKYRTEKKEQENKLQELLLQKQKIYLFFMSTMSLVIIIALVLVIRSNAITRRTNRELKIALDEISRKNKELEDARDKIRVLSGLLPICSYCKKIRNDDGSWGQMESYIDKHSEASFSHSICPICMDKYFPE
ncbi:MAG: tetratricopeptide repeat protein [Candidatus Delongbacteria bacterium]|nr:tetratricopeptide repeat protein [Candidatus Delongbacteria bacterium]